VYYILYDNKNLFVSSNNNAYANCTYLVSLSHNIIIIKVYNIVVILLLSLSSVVRKSRRTQSNPLKQRSVTFFDLIVIPIRFCCIIMWYRRYYNDSRQRKYCAMFAGKQYPAQVRGYHNDIISMRKYLNIQSPTPFAVTTVVPSRSRLDMIIYYLADPRAARPVYN